MFRKEFPKRLEQIIVPAELSREDAAYLEHVNIALFRTDNEKQQTFRQTQPHTLHVNLVLAWLIADATKGIFKLFKDDNERASLDSFLADNAEQINIIQNNLNEIRKDLSGLKKIISTNQSHDYSSNELDKIGKLADSLSSNVNTLRNFNSPLINLHERACDNFDYYNLEKLEEREKFIEAAANYVRIYSQLFIKNDRLNNNNATMTNIYDLGAYIDALENKKDILKKIRTQYKDDADIDNALSELQTIGAELPVGAKTCMTPFMTEPAAPLIKRVVSENKDAQKKPSFLRQYGGLIVAGAALCALIVIAGVFTGGAVPALAAAFTIGALSTTAATAVGMGMVAVGAFLISLPIVGSIVKAISSRVTSKPQEGNQTKVSERIPSSYSDVIFHQIPQDKKPEQSQSSNYVDDKPSLKTPSLNTMTTAKTVDEPPSPPKPKSP